MKKLLKNYINLLSIQNIEGFCYKNNIILNTEEKIYLLNLIKNNYEDILKNEEKYFFNLRNHINKTAYDKIIDLFYFYKQKYINYLT